MTPPRGVGFAGVLLAALLAAPVLIGAGYAALAGLGLLGAGASGLTTAPVRELLVDAETWRGLAWSLWVAGASTLAATAIAILVAALFRGSARVDRAARLLAVLPLPVPHVVAGLLGVQLLAQSGWLARVAHAAGGIGGPAEMPALVNDPWGVGLILVMTWKEAPFLAAIAIASLATRGAAAEEAARTLGAGRWHTLRLVTVPLLLRALLPAVVAVFVFVFGNFEVAALLAPSAPLALPLAIEERATDPDLARRAGAYVASLLAIGVAALAVVLHERARAAWSAEA